MIDNNKRLPMRPRENSQREEEEDLPRRTKQAKSDSLDKILASKTSSYASLDRPRKKESNALLTYIPVLLLGIVILGGAFFWWRSSSRKTSHNEVGNVQKQEKWYSVRVSTGESFYGQAIDLSSDPVELRNVYYDYDRLLTKGKELEAQSATSSLRLVKRGKETHGPDGTMEIVRSQIIYFEPLKEDSKVLKAILENEKK